MAEGTYEYECMRAELLDIAKPDYEAFMKEKQLKADEGGEEEEGIEAKEVEEDQIDNENLKEAESQGEQLKNVSGGLEELNNILSITQKKIDRFKVRCNSITSLLKMKVGSLSTAENHDGEGSSKTDEENGEKLANPNQDHEELSSNDTGNGDKLKKKSDLNKALDNHVDKLDAMLESADNAYHSMSQQNKKMKKFLK